MVYLFVCNIRYEVCLKEVEFEIKKKSKDDKNATFILFFNVRVCLSLRCVMVFIHVTVYFMGIYGPPSLIMSSKCDV